MKQTLIALASLLLMVSCGQNPVQQNSESCCSTKTIIASPKAPAAIGPYSQAVYVNGTLYISGQLPVIPETGSMPETIEEQTRQSLTNIGEILKEAGLTFDDVVKTTVLLDDIASFNAMNEVYAEFFTGDKPARACFQVAALPKAAKVEIEAVAVCCNK